MQARVDSLMEAVTNTVIGLVISTIANWTVTPMVLGHTITLAQNVALSAAFTVISIVRSYTLRRAFDCRTPWQALRAAYTRSNMSTLIQRILLAIKSFEADLIERLLERKAIALAYLARERRLAIDKFDAVEKEALDEITNLRAKLDKVSEVRDAVAKLLGR